MNISKKFDGVRWSLSQNKQNQVTIKREKEIVTIQNLENKLLPREAFNMLNKAPYCDYSTTKVQTKGNEEQLNMETEIIKEKIKVPTPNRCLFCGGIPKVITLKATENGKGLLRAIQCTGKACITSKLKAGSETQDPEYAYKRWIYTVDVVGNEVDKADLKLITEWNKRMPNKEVV